MAEYTELTRTAFREFVNLRILQRLDLPAKEKEPEKLVIVAEAIVTDGAQKTDESLTVTPLESEVFNYVKRRLAFLVKEDTLFEQLDSIDQRKYKGKFVVFYKQERLGRLFDFEEGTEKKYYFDFRQFGGVVETDNLVSIDKALLSVFTKRISDLASPAKK